jgi:thiosulfate dehydrogenase [quinone] large subunit
MFSSLQGWKETMTSGSSSKKRPAYLEPTQKLPAAAQPGSGKSSGRWGFPHVALLPLRLFLGITFLYAGLQKFSDPQFFHPGTPGYIGNQLINFARGSPLHNVLIYVALPHATAVGLLVALGEIAIGIGTLLGLLLRPAAFGGLLLSLIFFLTASWHVYPYFYGSDIVFVFCWITLLLVGPLHTGLPSVDGYLLQLFGPEDGHWPRSIFARVLLIVLGVNSAQELEAWLSPSSAAAVAARPQGQVRRSVQWQHQREVRRSFILGLLAGGLATVVLGLGSSLLLVRSFLGERQGTLRAPLGRGGASTTSSSSGASTATANAGAGTGTSGGTIIARKASLASNSALSFTVPNIGDPGILVHLPSDQFVAYDAICTHAGCQVEYDPSSQLLICPCHGATYDPAQGARVVSGPAPAPLSSVSIRIDSAGDIIALP